MICLFKDFVRFSTKGSRKPKTFKSQPVYNSTSDTRPYKRKKTGKSHMLIRLTTVLDDYCFGEKNDSLQTKSCPTVFPDFGPHILVKGSNQGWTTEI